MRATHESPEPQAFRWSVVVPVKRLEDAKTRLAPALDAAAHRDLARALVADTFDALALLCLAERTTPTGEATTGEGPIARVVVVTDDAWAAGAATAALAGPAAGGCGVHVVADLPDAGLNRALTYAADVARGLGPADGIATIGSDLPSLRGAHLAAALSAACRPGARSFVPDATGAGTTLLCAAPGVALDPAYGPDSRARHVASGAVALQGPWPTLRHDVDTLADLRLAAVMGVGRHVRAILVDLSAAGRGLLATDGDTGVAVPATVRHHGPDGAQVVLDNGCVIACPPDVRGSPRLRRGQRVHLETDTCGRVVRVRVGRPTPARSVAGTTAHRQE